MELGYWLSTEEHGPHDLVRFAQDAEHAGIRSALISDHFHPWVRRQGHAPFVWGVLGAIAATTTELRIGTGVTAPIIRMHPAVVAHAAATAAVQLDGRFFLGVGTGERLNEHVTGERWPGATERRSMLKEAVDIIRALLSGDNVNHRGEYYRVENAQLFTLPMTPPEIVMAVSGPKSAALAGQIADGILAVAPDASLVEGFEAAGGAGRPRMGQLHVCWAATAEQAMKTAAQQWPNGAIRGSALTDLARPKDFESVTSALADETIAADILCGPDPSPVVEAVARFAAAGYTTVYVHQIGPDQGGFLRFFIDDVLPHFD